MTTTNLKNILLNATGCNAQYNGRPCGTCFFTMSEELDNQDWQALLLTRGDYKRGELDNLPKDIDKSIEKILKIAENY